MKKLPKRSQNKRNQLEVRFQLVPLFYSPSPVSDSTFSACGVSSCPARFSSESLSFFPLFFFLQFKILFQCFLCDIVGRVYRKRLAVTVIRVRNDNGNCYFRIFIRCITDESQIISLDTVNPALRRAGFSCSGYWNVMEYALAVPRGPLTTRQKPF